MLEGNMGLIPDNVQTTLKIAACDLRIKKLDRMLFQGENFNGLVVTSWKAVTIGTRSGILFRSEVDVGTKSLKVNFLLSESDLKLGARKLKRMYKSGNFLTGLAPTIDVPALNDFSSLSAGGSRTRH